MFVVDTNILLYAADKHAPEHKICRDLLLEWREQSSPWHLTWGILYEFLRVATHPRVFRHSFGISEAWGFVRAILAAESLSILTETDRHERTATALIESVPLMSGNLVFDAHTVALMQEHGIKKIYTHDMDFHRFQSIEVLDPLK